MELSNLYFHPKDGFVHNWLVAGPVETRVSDLSSYDKNELELSILRHYYTPESGITEKPVDVGPLTKTDDPSDPVTWRYYRCEDDHFIDFTTFSPVAAYLCSWAFCQVEVEQEKNVSFILTSNGPADLWLNENHIHRHEHFHKQRPASVSIPTTLRAGTNLLLFRFEIASIRETPYVLALKIEDVSDDEITIVIPTEIESEFFQYRKEYEEVIPSAYLDRYVFGWLDGDVYDKNEAITVRFSQDMKISKPIPLTYRLQSIYGDIYQEGTKKTDASTVYPLAKNYPIWSGTRHLEYVPEASLYYIRKIRLKRHDLFYVVRTPYSNHLYSIIHERRREAIEVAAKMRTDSLYTEIAKIDMGNWGKIDHKIINRSFDRINERQEGCIVDLIGYIGLLLRFRRSADMPKDLRNSIENCLVGFRYWEDEPGEDLMDFKAESRQLLFHTCELLAGQLLLDRNFTNTSQNGRWHVKKAEKLITEWLIQHGKFGWQDWYSSQGFEEEIAALACLIDFANSSTISELASIMMDKTLFAIAINSFKGCFGSTHRRDDTASLLSSRLDPLSGVIRIMWGMGNFNEHLLGTVNLALLKKYDFPNLLRNIAVHPVEGFWDRERHGLPEVDPSQASEVNKVTYKTNHYLLGSAQNYRPFTNGSTEHIWQATLGPDAVVFVNHPTCFSHSDAHQPNFWNGNGSLPRVIQWGDILVAQYKLPEDDWLGFTHAYFPMTVFDEVSIEDHWAFARKGKGYLALYSTKGFDLVTHGQSANRELRSYGKENLWLCHMGMELLDGSFADFQEKIHSLTLEIEGMKLHFNNLRGDEITFDEEDHLIVNGQEQAVSGFRHFESPYCIADYPAEKMEIGIDDQGMRLNFTEE